MLEKYYTSTELKYSVDVLKIVEADIKTLNDPDDPDVDGNCYLTVPANTKEVYYDEDDKNTYDMGYYIIKYGYENLAPFIDSGELSVFEDDVKFNNGDEFLLFRSKYFKETFKNTNINFEDDNCGNMWYGLTTNKLHIFNPINKKWYISQMYEEV